MADFFLPSTLIIHGEVEALFNELNAEQGQWHQLTSGCHPPYRSILEVEALFIGPMRSKVSDTSWPLVATHSKDPRWSRGLVQRAQYSRRSLPPAVVSLPPSLTTVSMVVYRVSAVRSPFADLNFRFMPNRGRQFILTHFSEFPPIWDNFCLWDLLFLQIALIFAANPDLGGRSMLTLMIFADCLSGYPSCPTRITWVPFNWFRLTGFLFLLPL